MNTRPATTVISPDERAWALREVNLVRPPTHQWHRWQVVTVVRDDALAEWWRDLGPKALYSRPEVEIPSLGEHTVGELWDMAAHYRLQDDYWMKRTQELTEGCTLIHDFLEQKAEMRKVMRNQSVYGPGGHKQRDGFPHALRQRRRKA